MKIYINDLVKGHSDVKVKCLTFGLYTQVSDSGPLGPLVLVCVCIPILVRTFPEWLSGTEPLPHTPGAVCLSSLWL